MAALVEESSRDGTLRAAELEPVFRALYVRRFTGAEGIAALA